MLNLQAQRRGGGGGGWRLPYGGSSLQKTRGVADAEKRIKRRRENKNLDFYGRRTIS